MILRSRAEPSDLKAAVFPGVYYGSITVGAPSGLDRVVAFVNVSVHKKPGSIPLKQRRKAFKTTMGQRVAVVDIPCRRMGHQNIDPPVTPEREPQPGDPVSHLLLGIHIASVAIAV